MTVNFGDDFSGLTTVSFKLINSDGSTNQSETTTGVFEVQTDSGIYGCNIDFDNIWNGMILWSTGEEYPLLASEEIYINNTDTTSILDIVTEIDNKSDIIINTTNDIENKIDILNTDCTNLNEKIDIIDNKSDIIINTTNDINNKVDEILIDSTNIDIKLDIVNSKCTEISNDLKRVLGLIHENVYIDLPSYDDDSNLISARLRIYSNPTSVGSNNDVLATYIIESDSSGPGKFTNWSQIKS